MCAPDSTSFACSEGAEFATKWLAVNDSRSKFLGRLGEPVDLFCQPTPMMASRRSAPGFIQHLSCARPTITAKYLTQ